MRYMRSYSWATQQSVSAGLMIGACKNMPLCGVSISVTLLTYHLMSPFLFGSDGLAWMVSSQLSGEAAVASGSSSGSVRESVEDGIYNIWEVVPH